MKETDGKAAKTYVKKNMEEKMEASSNVELCTAIVAFCLPSLKNLVMSKLRSPASEKQIGMDPYTSDSESREDIESISSSKSESERAWGSLQHQDI
jgi:hypothetical protein